MIYSNILIAGSMINLHKLDPSAVMETQIVLAVRAEPMGSSRAQTNVRSRGGPSLFLKAALR